MKKERLDVLLVKNGIFASRERARTTIMAGKVLVNEVKIEKPGTLVLENAKIRLLGEVHPYVSRGGLKLQKALQKFRILLKGKVMVDVGASTGGFTDCALQSGAAKVYSIDVGYGQLDWKLRQDPRVVVLERTNVRNVTLEEFTDVIDFVSIDVSFISLRLVLPAVKRFLKSDGEVVCLVKPQFEAGKDRIGKKGVVKDPKIHIAILSEIMEVFRQNQFGIKALTFSPITGPEGNIEFLAYLILGSVEEVSQKIAEEIVKEAHQSLYHEEERRL